MEIDGFVIETPTTVPQRRTAVVVSSSRRVFFFSFSILLFFNLHLTYKHTHNLLSLLSHLPFIVFKLCSICSESSCDFQLQLNLHALSLVCDHLHLVRMNLHNLHMNLDLFVNGKNWSVKAGQEWVYILGSHWFTTVVSQLMDVVVNS